MSGKGERYSGESVEKVSAIMNTRLKIVNTTSDLSQTPLNVQLAVSTFTTISAPSERIKIIPNAPKKQRGVDHSHLMSVQELRGIFSPSARAKRASLKEIAKPIEKPSLKTVVTLPKKVIEEETGNNDSTIKLIEVVRPKSRVPFFYLGKCSKEDSY